MRNNASSRCFRRASLPAPESELGYPRQGREGADQTKQAAPTDRILARLVSASATMATSSDNHLACCCCCCQCPDIRSPHGYTTILASPWQPVPVHESPHQSATGRLAGWQTGTCRPCSGTSERMPPASTPTLILNHYTYPCSSALHGHLPKVPSTTARQTERAHKTVAAKPTGIMQGTRLRALGTKRI